jgi:6-phosphogluconolactonase
MRKVLLAFVLAAFAPFAFSAAGGAAGNAGAVYTLSNSTSGNAVLAYARAADGSLTFQASYPTGGLGTGGGLGSQGALVLSDDGHQLYAVNAASNTISAFAVGNGGLTFEAQAPSGGVNPISLTSHDHLLFVLNAGGAGNISGFSTDHGGLAPIAGSTRPLGVGANAPAEVSFSPDGKTLAVTEKNSNSIDTYAVDHDGNVSAPAAFESAGGTPFGFDWDNHGDLLASEAAGSASSYDVGPGGRLTVVSAAVPTGQAAPCWLVTSKDGRYAYTANGGGGTISAFSVGHDGSLVLLNGASASFGAGSHPLDEAITKDGRFLYNLTDGLHQISGFRIGDDGSLTPAGTLPGLPVGAAGIAAS